MTHTNNISTYRIARRVGDQGARSSATHGVVTEKSTTSANYFIKSKRLVHLSTFNVRTLNSPSKIGELIHLSQKFMIEVTCLQEHRIYHPDEAVKYHNYGSNWTLITSSAEKNSNNASVGGVGMLLSRKAANSLLKIESINSRIMIATFDGNPKLTLISCYSPTNVSIEEDALTFYTELMSVVHHVPKHNVLVIGGDMNAKIDNDVARVNSFHNSSNRNGEFMLDLMKECDLTNLTTSFCKRKGKLWTHKYPNGIKAQLDHMLINRKWQNSITNCETYNTYHSLGSDHRPCSIKLRLCLRANRNAKSKKIYHNWSLLTNDENVKEAYTIEVKNRFQILQDQDENATADSMYENIVRAHNESANLHVPVRKRNKRKNAWESVKVSEKRQHLQEAFDENQKNPNPTNKDQVEKAKRELDESYCAEQKTFVEEKILEIEKAHLNQKARLAWDTVNEITGRKGTKKGQIRAESPEERVQLWKEHFKNLLGQPPVIDDHPVEKVFDTLPVETNDFTEDELVKAIHSLKNNKAAGLDGIPAEVWKTSCLNKELLEVCNKTYHGDVPKIWLHGGIKPLPKKGDLGVASNYRGITLTAVAAKIYNRMLLNRLKPHIDPRLRINQNGFRTGRSTIAQVLTLRRLVEGIKAKKLTAVMTFVDFRKAFDSVHRGKLMKVLKAYGVPDEIIAAINVLYTNTMAQVLSPDGDTAFFEILAGVLQGDTLAPYLFIISLDYAMRIATANKTDLGFTLKERRSRRYPAVVITDTDFADDISLLSDTLRQAEELLHSTQKAARQIGLHINESKTEFMSFNIDNPNLKTDNGKPLKHVDDFLYLGSWINSCDKDISTRIGKSWSALNKLNIIWKSTLPTPLKIAFFKSTVQSVLLYGSSTWTLTKSLAKRLDGAYTKMLRVVKGVTWRQHVTNDQLYGDLVKISEVIKEQRTKFSGHCWRSKEETIHKLLLWEPLHGKRPRGRPTKTYIDQIVDDTDIPKENLATAMEDRKYWKECVNAIRLRSIR